MFALQLVAVVIGLAATAVGWTFFINRIVRFVRYFKLGAPTLEGERTREPWARTVTLLREFLGHTRMARLPIVAIAHWVTMVSFGVLVLTLAQATMQLFNPYAVLPLIGHFFPYEWVTEFFAFFGLLGIIYLIVVRQLNKPKQKGRYSRFFGSTFWEAYYVEFTILGVAGCIALLRGAEYVLQSRTGELTNGILHFPFFFWIGELLSGASTGFIEAFIVVVALIKLLISYAWMVTVGITPTMGVAWHRFLAFPNIWFKRHADGRTSLGPLQPMVSKGEPIDFENMEDMDEDASMGAGKIEDFTWKGLLDFSTCTECGRCQSQCPAWNTEKPLSPKLMIMNLRNHANAKAPWMQAAQQAQAEATPPAEPGPDADKKEKKAYAKALDEYNSISDPHENLDLLGTLSEAAQTEAVRPLVGAQDVEELTELGVIDPDALWSCTTCGACVEQCPVDIEHVDHFVDMRRYQVLIESAFPSELSGLFKNLENKQNPWGMSQRKRMEWAKNLDFEVKQVGADIEDLGETEYLFWVGCAGAFEDRAMKTTQAVAELLHIAGVDFAVLGDGESCTGDPARRAGNEFLFQMLAQANVEVLNEMKARKIVVTCAHCFNTIANEYPQLGGNFEVVHHTQLLNRLVRDKRLTPVAPAAGEAVATPVTYHDPCYLGRHNGIYTPPRELIGSLPGVEYREMERSKEWSFCCGAGGARMWMEETIGSRININRTKEAVATGAEQIAIGCPFCRVMLSDGLTSEQAEGNASDGVEVLDVSQMLLAGVRRGQGGTGATAVAPAETPS
ncbi:Fe-S oxidoreductase [Brevibacterium sanguinis]|uniref:Fe-S oxidoreductase n=2 Tax=Brevibacterium TaxID=1696 RepID=A0A366ILK4_9MICO|nr:MULTISPECIES: (Fe-S)-binding protein [Brevibacterium]RBP67073.1 Fe-S oxidoreductase [Brevibacterium sanguinis]RBP73598.1 Fe-S oxidoreductase [Brevibacterium celere]